MPYNGTMEHVTLCFDDVLKEQRNRDRVSTYRLTPHTPPTAGAVSREAGNQEVYLAT